MIFRRGSFSIRTVTLYLYLQIYNQKHSALQNRNSANNLQPTSACPCKVPHRHPVGVGVGGGGTPNIQMIGMIVVFFRRCNQRFGIFLGVVQAKSFKKIKLVFVGDLSNMLL